MRSCVIGYFVYKEARWSERLQGRAQECKARARKSEAKQEKAQQKARQKTVETKVLTVERDVIPRSCVGVSVLIEYCTFVIKGCRRLVEFTIRY